MPITGKWLRIKQVHIIDLVNSLKQNIINIINCDEIIMIFERLVKYFMI